MDRHRNEGTWRLAGKYRPREGDFCPQAKGGSEGFQLRSTLIGLCAAWGYLECSSGFPVVNFKESKYEITKSSSFTRRRSRYDFRCFDFVGAWAGKLWRR